MGKKDKKKEKKIKGAVKTAAKTEKNALKRMKKEFSTKGEDLDAIIASVQEDERKRNLVVENVTESLTLRSGLSLSANSEKDELIFFGGEYFNGSKTTMYNELYTYNIKKDKWLQISSPNGPLPRCSHQAVFVPQMGGQLWVFGGEFSSPTHSQFRHYSDLWVFHFNEKTWEQIKASGGPSSRSGHRMTLSQKKLFVFGGFHESVRDYKYFNDVYTFDLENRKWSKIEAKSNPPSPRSGCQIAPLSDGGILIYGGYSREKIKRDIDKGTVHSDMYLLQPDKKQADLETGANAITKWKWVQVKQSGPCPSPRCGFAMTLIPNANKVILFGGVFDVEESEESIQGQFFNDLYQLELDSGKWSKIQLRGSGEIKSKRRRKVKEDGDGESDAEGEIEDPALEPKVESMTIEDKEQVVADDGIFVVKMGPSISSNDGTDASQSYDDNAVATSSVKAFSPHPRMNSCLVAKSGMLYLFGGTYEDGDRQLTLADFYALDLKKLDEWKTLVAMDAKTQEWLESDSSGESGSGSDDDNDDDEEDDDKSNSSDEDMEVDKEGDQTR